MEGEMAPPKKRGFQRAGRSGRPEELFCMRNCV